MKSFSKLLAAAILVMATTFSSAADILENFSKPGSTVSIEQPEALAKRLQPGEATEATDESDSESDEDAAPATRRKGKMVGYRVQVYADSNARVAKGEARHRERAVGNRFPSMSTYVAYAAPYWRLRVGDFPTQGEAEKAASEIRRAFPRYAKEVRVGRDRVNVR